MSATKQLIPLVLAGILYIPLATADNHPPRPTAAERPLTWAQQVQDTAAINNLYRITPSLYRSAKLTPEDIPRLQQLGIRKIISFRAFHSDRALLAGTQITMLNIPIHTWNIRDEDMIAALKALRDVERDGPILIHCQHGADRTGLVAALYRMVYQGWSKEAALDELQHGGYGFHAMWRNINRYIDRVDIDSLRRRVNNAATPAGESR